jgi:GDP-fucose transporter C1
MALSGHSKIAAVVLAYFTISISLVFMNKLLLTEGASIPAPMFVTWYQCVITAAICYALGTISEGAEKDTFLAQFPKQKYDIPTASRVLPLSVVFVGMITFNNLCLQYVEVSFYNVARSLTIVCNVIFTYAFLGQHTSMNTMICLCVVVLGFFVGADGEVNFNLVGTLFGVTSSIFVSLNSIYTKKVLPVVDQDHWKLSFYNNFNASLLFIPLIFISGEAGVVMEHYELLFSSYFWVLMTMAGVFGFMIGIVVVMQIKLTSPLTHNISGTAKACVQTILALFIWQNETTAKAMLGLGMVLFGSLAYAKVRMTEAKAAKEATKEAEARALEMEEVNGLLKEENDENV